VIKQLLLAPGPTPVPARVRLAMAQPMFHHRTPQFSALFAEVRVQLQELYQTEQDVLMLAASGTGAMEAAVNNCFAPGDEVVVVNGGKFGERWLKLAATFGVTPIEIRVEWGRAVRPAQIEAALAEHPNARGVLMQGSETSPAAVHPIEQVAAITRRRDVLLVVDGITSVGVYDIPMDAWGIDVLITGSQKALMLPPGLATIALSARAWQRVESVKQPRFYFDLPRERTNQAKNTTAWTPAISLVIGLHEALAMMQEEGFANVFARHARLAAATRAGCLALGLRLVAPDNPSPAVTGVYTPDGIDGGRLFAYLRDKMKVVFAGGQDHLKGKIIRIAHIGYIDAFDTITALAALEMALKRFGHPVDLGRGVGAAEAALVDALPAT
jgi:aspartate aminotransferase-like enzyme